MSKSTISAEENLVIRGLKQKGILRRFSPSELKGLSKNGGVGVICADGDIDAFTHHMKMTHRPHCQRNFGGALLYAPSFKGYNRFLADGLKYNLKLGMGAKDTKTLYLYFHAPCGIAELYDCGIEEQLGLAKEARDFFVEDDFFAEEKIHLFFHVKRINRAGTMEQNTYRINF